MKPIIIHPAAKLELREAQTYHEEQRVGLGERFLQAVERTIREIQTNPKRCERYRRSPCRFWLVRRFRYVIYFRDMAKEIRIIAVAHGSRRPGYWRNRLKD